jgi:tetratricopeptide (TPR) repeat protein
MMRRAWLAAVIARTVAGCASNPVVGSPAAAATIATYPVPDVPASLRASGDTLARHDAAWRRMQSGDLRGAQRDFAAIVKAAPGFYPAITALGFIDLANRQYKDAVTRFTAAGAMDANYLPAWQGLADAALAAHDDEAAIAGMTRVLAIDPGRADVRTRLEIVRLRQVQALVEAGRTAREAGKLDEAHASLDRALSLSPTSTMILRELVTTEMAQGALAPAEAHARQATTADAGDGEAWMALAEVLQARVDWRGAAEAARGALAIDPRADWRARARALGERADAALLPPEFARIADAPAVTRGEAAAFVGTRLETLIARAPRRPVSVATDVRTHWAATWILAVTRAGVMDVYANHTFQPAAPLRRSDLAQIVSRLLPLATAGRPAELQRWRAARPTFADVAATNLAYRSAAAAVASGAMTAPGGRFEPTRTASGADLDAAAARVIQLTH